MLNPYIINKKLFVKNTESGLKRLIANKNNQKHKQNNNFIISYITQAT